MIFLVGIFFCLVTIGLADNTARKLNFEGFFTIFGISESNFTEQNNESNIIKLLQIEIDHTLNFVSWQVILTSYSSVKNTNNANDDYAIGDLNFVVEAFLAPEDDVAQYYSDIVGTLNHILVDELLSGIPLDALRGAHIPAGSLTIADGLSVTDGQTLRPSSSPVIIPEKLHLLMLGDWGKGGVNGDITAVATSSATYNKRRNLGKNGGTDYTFQAAVARSMIKYVRYINLRAVILLGDNFYNSGVTSTTDALWNTLWRNVYLNSGSPLNVPWYAVLGNHDYGSASNAEAQINRYQKYDTDDNNWIMPSHNYTQKFDIIGGGSVQIIFIDTTTLAPSVNKCCNEKGGVSLAQQAVLITNQLKYIESQLEVAAIEQPTWLIVVGHYPVYSAGEHGDNAELKTYLQPLLEKYNVDAYFCGHDHISEHLEKEGVQYFVAGAGALTDKVGSKNSEGALVWAGAGYSAFAAVAATDETFTVNFVNIYGETVYSHTMLQSEKAVTTPGTVLEAEPTSVDLEPIYNTAWILDSLGAENVSQAALKISGITVLCVIIAVAVIIVLDANFVARMKSAEEALNVADNAISADEMGGKDVEEEESYRGASMKSDCRSGEGSIELGGGEEAEGLSEPEESRRYLPSSVFGNAYRQLNATISVVMEGTLPSTSDRSDSTSHPAPLKLDDSSADRISFCDSNLEFADSDSKIFRV